MYLFVLFKCLVIKLAKIKKSVFIAKIRHSTIVHRSRLVKDPQKWKNMDQYTRTIEPLVDRSRHDMIDRARSRTYR